MNKYLRKVVRVLRKDAPPLLPTRVYQRRRLGVKAFATCELKTDSKSKPRGFVINIQAGVNEDHLVLLLLHEWAHARTWKDGDNDDALGEAEHGPAWALEYGRLYNLLFED